ncbi:hypothetical protein [Mesorhizobium sp. A556]
MKLATAVTLDGLIRALRWTAHDLAEAVETGHAPEPTNEKPTRRSPRHIREQVDDRAGR